MDVLHNRVSSVFLITDGFRIAVIIRLPPYFRLELKDLPKEQL